MILMENNYIWENGKSLINVSEGKSVEKRADGWFDANDNDPVFNFSLKEEIELYGVEIVLAASTEDQSLTSVSIYWPDEIGNYYEKNTSKKNIFANGDMNTIFLGIPKRLRKKYTGFRFDPISAKGRFYIEYIKIHSNTEHSLFISERKKNENNWSTKAYKSCVWIEGGIAFADDGYSVCCEQNYDGMNSTRVCKKNDVNNFPFEKLSDVRQNLRQTNQLEIPPPPAAIALN